MTWSGGFCLILWLVTASRATKVYDFESIDDRDAFTSEGSSHKLASGIHKSGNNSLLWSWDKGNSVSAITLKLAINIPSKDLLKGGVRLWMYRNASLSDAVMKIKFSGNAQSDPTVAPVPSPQVATINLNFNGWRAVWLGYEEMSLTGLTGLDLLEFTISSTPPQANHVYFDLLRFIPKQLMQTRDLVVPPIPGQGLPKMGETWQQGYRWLQFPVPAARPYSNRDALLREIDNIEERLHNWYANEKWSSYRRTGDEMDTYRQSRWETLMTMVDIGNANYSDLTFADNGTKILGPSLFTKVSEYGRPTIEAGPDAKLKLGTLMQDVLLPLGVGYHMRSRPLQVTDTAEHECEGLGSNDAKIQFKSLLAIAGNNSDMINILKDALPRPIDCSNKGSAIIPAINKLNSARLDRILRLLDFVEEQGWTYGSAVGSLDHQMNRNGAGYMQAIFVIREYLRRPENTKRLDSLIKSMKWFNDFNEIYQRDEEYIYNGTTADRMRTILLYRLMIILMIPNSRGDEKIRDMQYFKNWAEHSLKINKALGGVVKPDYTGFHHKTFYGSAYVAIAYHNAAFVQYLLSGTSFALGQTARDNLRQGLEVLRTVAVKYSTPVGLAGRFPDYSRGILSQHFPMYAYIAYDSGNANRVKEPSVRGADIFLRLFDLKEPKIQEYLSNGDIEVKIFYLNSIGSLDVMQKVVNLAAEAGESEEPPPQGHWSKNFGSVNIHRRKNWAVAAKGMSNYVWDFESSGNENVFGIFLSYGSLQISNSEDSLSSYDIYNGWNWTRIPGATSVNLELKNIRTDRARYYNPKDLGGGMAMRGTAGKTPQNGIFGMDFRKPEYLIKKWTPMLYMTFLYKKSYFFMEELVVAVGSDIILGNITGPYYAQTTLFQNKLVNPGLNNLRSYIRVDGKPHNLNDVLPERTEWNPAHRSAEVVDTNGNTYFVPNPTKQGLHLRVGDQKSKTDSGQVDTQGRYAVAWLKHRNESSFNYAVVLAGGDSNKLFKYSVEKLDSVAHIVKFKDLPSAGSETFGYVFFKGNEHVTAGPVYRVSASCTLMTERESRDLHVALSNPRFQLVEDEAMKNSVTCQEKSGRKVRSVDDINSDDHDGDGEGEDNVEIIISRDAHRIKKREAPGSKSPESAVPIFPHRNSNHVTDDYRYCRKSDETEIVVTLSSSLRVRNMRNVTVDGKAVKKADQEKYLQIEEGGKKIRFSKLANGFTTEAKFEVFEDDNSDAKSGACSLLADSVFKVLLGVALIIALGVASN
ncbi:predicted protein [Nematostella vectensis]|uniref:Chondroitin sulfate ABC lyase n=1 Tax=Nematostella vectensis TaxID=45351 RepID=A7S592_NEMVE|nr:chondroitin sulfate ABC exolyase [Nematostella vectensis]EDO41162.1 predicted protein [Nematostella vectensis]|eukprot:XP_001633225.1 predicted protein [Nematostella vectensis]